MASSAPNTKQTSAAIANTRSDKEPYFAADVAECWDVSVGNGDELVGRFGSKAEAFDYLEELSDAGATEFRVFRSVITAP